MLTVEFPTQIFFCLVTHSPHSALLLFDEAMSISTQLLGSSKNRTCTIKKKRYTHNTKQRGLNLQFLLFAKLLTHISYPYPPVFTSFSAMRAFFFFFRKKYIWLITTNVIIYVTDRDRPCNILTQVPITCFTRQQVCVCKLVNCPQFLSFFSLLTRPQADGDSSPTSKLHRLLAESRQMVQNLEQSTTFSLSGSPKQVSFLKKSPMDVYLTFAL